jgi:hypothetical protein
MVEVRIICEWTLVRTAVALRQSLPVLTVNTSTGAVFRTFYGWEARGMALCGELCGGICGECYVVRSGSVVRVVRDLVVRKKQLTLTLILGVCGRGVVTVARVLAPSTRL